ncbi:hypothetical protein Hanom_Chr06g00522931 [Helianthus anomalus]
MFFQVHTYVLVRSKIVIFLYNSHLKHKNETIENANELFVYICIYIYTDIN